MKLPWPFTPKPPPPKPETDRRRAPALNDDGTVEYIFLGSHSINLIRRLCATGRYLGPTDVLVTALRLLEEHEDVREARKPPTLRPALPAPHPADQNRR